MTYTTLSLSDVRAELEAMARDAQSAFGHFDAQQLNWRPDDTRWSVAQCFEHLIATSDRMFEAMDAALDRSRPRTLWERLPLLPRVFGPMLVRSQGPEAARKFTAPPAARPSASAIDGRIIDRFVASQQDAVRRAGALAERDAGRIVMTSPFVRFIVYSVLDGFRLIATHQRRHFEQARRVIQEPGFPATR